MNLSSSFYRLILGYYSPSTHHPHKQYSSYLSALLEIIISVSGEKPLPVRGLLLQHHNHATKVASLLLFLFFLRQLNSMYFFFLQCESEKIYNHETLRTFAPIPTVHPYSARKFTCHVMHRARALSTKMNNRLI